MSHCTRVPDLRRAFGAAALLAVVAGCPALPPRGTVPLEHAAGLPRVVLLPDDGVDAVHVSVTLPVGAARDPLGQEGLAGLAATAALADAPGELRVSHATATLTATCPVGDGLAPCLAAMAGAVVGLEVSDEAVDRARQAQRAQLDALREGPDAAALAVEVARAWQFEAHALGHPVAGRDDVVTRTGADVVQAFWARHAARASTVVGLAGPVPTAEVGAFLDAFRALPATVVPRLATMSPLVVSDRRLLVVTRPAVGAAVAVVLLTPPPGLDPAADVALQVLVDRVGGALDRRDGAAVITVPVGPLDAAVDTIVSTVAWLDEVRTTPLGPDRLEAARARVLARVADGASTPALRLQAACAEVATGTPDLGRLGTDAYAALDVAQVEATLRDRFPSTALRVVVVGSPALADLLGAPDVATRAGLAGVSVREASTLFR